MQQTANSQQTFPICLLLFSFTQSCLTLCNPKTCSMLGIPVLYYFPEFAQTHVHQVSDAIQPSYPLSSPSPLALSLSQHSVFSNESALCIRWPEYQSFSFSISPSNKCYRVGFLLDWLVWSPCSPRDSQVSCPAPQYEGISSLVLSLFYYPALTPVHDYWKNHSFCLLSQGNY